MDIDLCHCKILDFQEMRKGYETLQGIVPKKHTYFNKTGDKLKASRVKVFVFDVIWSR